MEASGPGRLPRPLGPPSAGTTRVSRPPSPVAVENGRTQPWLPRSRGWGQRGSPPEKLGRGRGENRPPVVFFPPTVGRRCTARHMERQPGSSASLGSRHRWSAPSAERKATVTPWSRRGKVRGPSPRRPSVQASCVPMARVSARCKARAKPHATVKRTLATRTGARMPPGSEASTEERRRGSRLLVRGRGPVRCRAARRANRPWAASCPLGTRGNRREAGTGRWRLGRTSSSSSRVVASIDLVEDRGGRSSRISAGGRNRPARRGVGVAVGATSGHRVRRAPPQRASKNRPSVGYEWVPS